MRVVDANVLLYAVNEDAVHHERSAAWLDRGLSGEDTIGLSWIVLVAFLRLATNPNLFSTPLTVAEASSQVSDWIAAPGSVVVQPGAAHVDVLSRLLLDLGTGANLVNDAHLAALAIEHRAEIVSYDNDFSRFSGVTWRRPDDLVS